MNYLEVEYKYKLPNKTDFNKFRDFVFTLIKKPELGYCSQKLGIWSSDHYFSKNDDFLRYRTMFNSVTSPELTIKKKLHKDSISSRVEVNLLTTSTYGDIEEFAKLLKYKFDFSLNKHYDIWAFEDVHLSHYSVEVINVCDVNYKFPRKQHFVEVEVCDCPVVSYSAILNKWEKLLKPFGITKKERVDKSLFDMYRCSLKRSTIQKKIDRAKNIS